MVIGAENEFVKKYREFHHQISSGIEPKSIFDDALNNLDALYYVLAASQLGYKTNDLDPSLLEIGNSILDGLENLIDNTNLTFSNNLKNYGIQKNHLNHFEYNELKRIWNGQANSYMGDSMYKQLNPVEIIALYIGIDAAKKNKIEYDKDNFSNTISTLVGFAYQNSILRKKILILKNKSKNDLDDSRGKLILRMDGIDEYSKNRFMEYLIKPSLKDGWTPEFEAQTFNSKKVSYINDIFQRIEGLYNANNRS